MEWYKWTALVICSLVITMAADAYGVTIHDVNINGTSLGPVSGANCAQLDIGSTAGTTYGGFTIQGADGINPARIRAIENGANCYGLPVNARDRLLFVNARIIPNANGVNVDLTIEYRGEFGPIPNGAVVFGGSMTGQFRKNNAGVTCSGNTPPNGPCKVTYETAVFSQVDLIEYGLPTITRTNPLNGSFNVAIPASSPINVGTLNRDLHSIFTTRLPSVDHRLEVNTQVILLGPPTGQPGEHIDPRDVAPPTPEVP